MGLENIDNLRSSHPVERVLVPAPLNHVPHPIRHFRMIRPRWSLVAKHREEYCGFDHSGERRLTGEELRET